MRLRLTLVMLRGRVEYHGLSRLAMGSNSLTLRCPDRANERLRLRALGACRFIDDENPKLSFLAI